MEASATESVWLIGQVTPNFAEVLPTIREVMRVYFHYRLVLLTSKKDSVARVIKDLIEHAKNLGVDTIRDFDAIRKINNVISKHEAFKKSMHRDTETQRLNERKFIDLLNQPFVIATTPNYHRNKTENVQKSVKCEVSQITSSFININSNADIEMDEIDTDLIEGCDSQYESIDEDYNNNNDSDYEMTLSKYQFTKLTGGPAIKEPGVIHKIINSPDVSSTLDRTGISAPQFTMLCAAIAGAVNEDLSQCTLSTSTCYRRRKYHRSQIVSIIKDNFISTLTSNLVLHWDGKKLLDSTNDDITLRSKKVERLAVVVSGADIQKIITIAKTKDGSGLVISDTVYEHVAGWNILDKIIGICTDTTITNTGTTNGSVALFQLLLKRNVLYFACRHHVMELIIGGVFIGLFGETTGPCPEMFANFKRDWHIVDQTSFQVRL